MATNFPTSLDTSTNLPNPASTDVTSNANPNLSHAYQHYTINAAILALEAKVGINASAVTSSVDYRLSQLVPAATTFQTVTQGAGSATFPTDNVYVSSTLLTLTLALAGLYLISYQVGIGGYGAGYFVWGQVIGTAGTALAGSINTNSMPGTTGTYTTPVGATFLYRAAAGEVITVQGKTLGCTSQAQSVFRPNGTAANSLSAYKLSA